MSHFALDGHYYPRIYRPSFPMVPGEDGDAFYATGTSFLIAIHDLGDLLQYVEPAVETMDTFGHRIRQQLLFASMEVEAGWAGVLRANGYNLTDRFTTRDYVKLAVPLKLGDYRVRLKHYPRLPDFRPFEGWSPANPTRSLAWYDAYNATKHDREQHLKAATLRHLLHSVAGIYVLMAAQFGLRYVEPGGPYFQDYLAVTFAPDLLSTDYVAIPGAGWSRGAYQF